MDERTRTALGESIEKWIVLSSGDAHHEPRCILCDEFNAKINSDCKGCPVAEVAGQSNCDGTPYYTWQGLYVQFGFNDSATIFAAKTELKFLLKIYRDGTGEDYKPEADAS